MNLVFFTLPAMFAVETLKSDDTVWLPVPLGTVITVVVVLCVVVASLLKFLGLITIDLC